MSDAGELPWTQKLASELEADDPEKVAASFAARTPASYRDLTSPAEAAGDIEQLSRLSDESSGPGSSPSASDQSVFGGRHGLVVRPSNDPLCTFRIRRYGEGGIELTKFLPVLESFGLVVVEAVPHRIAAGGEGEPAMHIDDIGVRTEAPQGPETLRFVPEIHGPRLVDALEALARGEADVDSLNRLVTLAGFDWRQVTVLRCYLRYRLQVGTPLSWSALSDPLVDFPDVARGLIGYFQARFDPGLARGADPADRPWTTERARCLAELDLVPQLEQDRVLRGYLSLIDATLRSNYFQRDLNGAYRPALVIKFDSAVVPELPAPRPKVEAFVHSPRIEGVHLRAGLIARGGLRWSERLADFRTEVLDLAFAQVKKNAIIVPTGAKGGFVCRRPPQSSRPNPEQIEAAYTEFVHGLLDITDNIVAGRVVHPSGVVAHDGSDPYLVVAADKGTATYSDIANRISDEVGFWLGDAFASGGSRGYDHKAMGITARGAWVAVRRHFHQLGVDVQVDPIRVAGVGDMSGDVFGNGMLRSKAIRLQAAFDHRHIFLDPDPDPERSFDERARLAALPRSSWADYRSEAISAGGGVWPRDAKSIPLSPEARSALGVGAESLSPPAVISAILAAPVDLFWFGGIGTYIKAPDESDLEVGDHANDGVRVTSDAIRARVIAEGANLGITQRARIRYSRRGGRINADFIDNAAGVATSDREVNLKILLALAIDEGRLRAEDRDRYLVESEPEVVEEVLRQVDHSVVALNRAATGSASELDAYEALIESLEAEGRVDRQVESLPSREELEIRRQAGAGLIRPELAVVLAYAKSELVAAIEDSPIVARQAFLDAVTPYFPRQIRDDFGDLIARHRLYPQLLATDVAGEIVDQLGIVWAHETAAELGRDESDVAGSFWAARTVTRAGALWKELEQLSPDLSADAEDALHEVVRRAVSVLARAYLTTPGHFDTGATIARDLVLSDELVDGSPSGGAGPAPASGSAGEPTTSPLKAEEDSLVGLGVDRAVAHHFLEALTRSRVSDAARVIASTERSATEAVRAVDLVDQTAGLDRLAEEIQRAVAPPASPGRLTAWQARALLDDMAEWRRAAAVAALTSNPDGDRPGTGSVDQAVAAWAGTHETELVGAATLLTSLDHGGADPLTVAALVIRRLRLVV